MYILIKHKTIITGSNELMILFFPSKLFFCVYSTYKYVKVGSHYVDKQSDGDMVRIKAFDTHPDAKPVRGSHNIGWPSKFFEQGHWPSRDFAVNPDVSIIVLERIVSFTRKIQPICLPQKTDQDYRNEETYTSGWGNTNLVKKGGALRSNTPSAVAKHTKIQCVVVKY